MVYSKFFVKNHTRRLLMNNHVALRQSARSFGVLPFFGRILKLRYLFLGSAVGGGVAIHNVKSFFA